ncbi:MAG: prolyl oligopeptidase family serine peptidase [Bacteroidales bacterium]|nr:prolyl oligopeptidase family serine peptidase [Bacteroidales bacterium]
MKKLILSSLLLLCFTAPTWAQSAKKPMTINDVVKWNRITERQIAPDGSFIAVKLEPWQGSTTVKLYDNKGTEIFSADSSSTIHFTKDSQYLLYKRGDGKKASLHVYSIKNKTTRVEDELKNFYLPKDWSDALVMHKNDSTLTIEKLDGSNQIELGKATVIKFAEKSNALILATDSIAMLYRAGTSASELIWNREGKIDRIAISESGDKVTIVADKKLHLWSGDDWSELTSNVSDKRDPYFSPNGLKLFFGLLPPARVRDTTLSKDDFPEVHVWHWEERVQFTQQVVNKKRDLDANYLAVYDLVNGRQTQLTSEVISGAQMIEKGNSDYVLALSDWDYQLESMWEGRGKYDVYLINTTLGQTNLITRGVSGQVRISPASRYAFWYHAVDSSWYACSLPNAEVVKITDPKTIRAFNEESDTPDYPSSYSSAGWSKDDQYFLIYDKYDIWRVDPKGKEAPVRLTQNGREKGLTYRYIATGPAEQEYIDLKGEKLLNVFNHATKGFGFWAMALFEHPANPSERYGGNFMLGGFSKAENANAVIFTRERFSEFPNICFSNLKFDKVVKITDANPQQNNFIWGTAELISWVSLEGIELQGVLYKPENFDPTKKYPMIVNFYEKNSSTLYGHRIPEAHRSTIDYHMYNSNGYVIFNPDIVYKEGYPGESAYNAVMPSISTVLAMGFVDPQRIGAQGHSWGGYQVAYLATRTNLFAAIESGAPVVNMFSAYGGIRWGTGLNRSFQYEHSQSRIGKTPWEAPLRYFENSPIFTMDKVTTPILILHNDQDDAVPWYQGIEYFVALKRLRKPVWMLNYTGEVHWPQKMKNKIDFQKRMMQFFDHYLKDAPMPQWMAEPMTLIDLDYQTGY